jgi:hypothetical protein
MRGFISLKRIWQDEGFFEIEMICASEVVTAKTDIYTTNDKINDLANKIEQFILGKQECLWENGEKGNAQTPYVSMIFSYLDKMGHVKIEVYMEIDDGGEYSKHNCCFYIFTEYGLLLEFQKKLHILMDKTIGKEVILNN